MGQQQPNRNKVHLFEQRTNGASFGKVFHYALGGAKVRRGRETTMCGEETWEMRVGAWFRPGDPKGAVHFKYSCPGCVQALVAHVETYGL